MSDNSSSASGGIGLGGLLTVLFVGLKLTHYIDWSWWWVTAPLWIPAGVMLGFVAFCLLMAGIVGIISMVTESRQRKARAVRRERGW